MTIILDASAALVWAFQDEQSILAEHALDTSASEGLLVPAFWPLEIASGLRQGERQGRIDLSSIESFIRSLEALSIAIETVVVADVLSGPLRLARQYNLSVYDATYLDLAIRQGLPLATLDRALTRAAREAGVELLA